MLKPTESVTVWMTLRQSPTLDTYNMKHGGRGTVECGVWSWQCCAAPGHGHDPDTGALVSAQPELGITRAN